MDAKAHSDPADVKPDLHQCRVLVYGMNYAPELIGVGKYTGELCSYLAAEGADVRVITTPPITPAGRRANPIMLGPIVTT